MTKVIKYSHLVMSRGFALICLLAFPIASARAQMQAGAAPSIVSDVSLVGPEMIPGLLPSLAPEASVREALAPILPATVVITNTGSRKILYFSVRFLINKPNSATRTLDVLGDYRQQRASEATFGFGPGQATMLSGTVEWARPIASAQMIARHGDPSQLTAAISRYANARFAATLDFVLWDDGTSGGPDQSGSGERLFYEAISRSEIQSELRNLAGKTDIDVRNWLDGVLAERSARPRDPRMSVRRRVALQLKGELNSGRPRFDSAVLDLSPYPVPVPRATR